MQIYGEVLIYFVGFFLVLFFLRLFRKPLALLLRALFSIALGGIFLLLVNTFGGQVGLHLAVNPVTAFLAGTLGLPGVLLLLCLTHFV